MPVGVDIIEIRRIEQAISRWGDRFLSRIFTPEELRICQGRPHSLAARFAAKEATIKVLQGRRGIRWRDIEIVKQANGAPLLRLNGGALQAYHRLSLEKLEVSLSHSREYAIAIVCAR